MDSACACVCSSPQLRRRMCTAHLSTCSMDSVFIDCNVSPFHTSNFARVECDSNIDGESFPILHLSSRFTFYHVFTRIMFLILSLIFFCFIMKKSTHPILFTADLSVEKTAYTHMHAQVLATRIPNLCHHTWSEQRLSTHVTKSINIRVRSILKLFKQTATQLTL
jgi:hypothetical protein